MEEVNNIWEMQKTNSSIIEHLKDEIKISSTLAKILCIRGVEDYKSAQNYFRPNWSSFNDGFQMKGMRKSVERLNKAKVENQNILVYGDYDVDGTCSVAMMTLFLKNLTTNIFTYQPDRDSEGYGISLKSVKWMVENEIDLVIALDCGIKDIKSAKEINNNKIDLIVCDHHNPGDVLPDAFSILNPKQKDCNYLFKELCGCGVGLKLIQSYDNSYSMNFDYSLIIQLAAIATVADIVPLKDENRLITYLGLKSINETPMASLKKLFELTKKLGKINSSDLVFKIAPRINAAGRLDNAKKAMDFLISNDENLELLGNQIESINKDRREMDEKTTNEALTQLSNQPLERSTNVVFSPSWHKGVVGIVASRIIEKYYKPTIVLTGNGDTISGSARSVKGFDIYKILDKLNHYFIRFGGHKYAAGLTIHKNNLNNFSIDFENEVNKSISQEQKIPIIKIDSELSINDLALDVSTNSFPKIYRIIQQMEPFGPANPKPVFLFKSLNLCSPPRLVGEKHIKLKFSTSNLSSTIDGIWFNSLDRFNKIKSQSTLDVVATLSENFYNGKTSLQLMINDVRSPS